MNIAIIYHDADFDGKLSKEVCFHWLNKREDTSELHTYGWDYGRVVPNADKLSSGKWDDYDQIYIVDLSVDELMAREDLRQKMFWIDHHASAIAKHGHTKFQGYRIDGVAACRLCWQWFSHDVANNVMSDPAYLPTKNDYVSRTVTEPELIRLAGEYDIWDHRDPDAKALQFGLRTLDAEQFNKLVMAEFTFTTGSGEMLKHCISAGHAIKSYCDKQNDEYSASYSQTVQWEGLCFCALNIGQRGNSDLLLGGIKPEHQACLAWRWDGKQAYVSLYHIDGHTDIDLSVIATKHGGGGHRGACGFRCSLNKLGEIIESVTKGE